MKTNKYTVKHILLVLSVVIAFAGVSLIYDALGGTFYGKTKFMDDVSVGSWTSKIESAVISNISGGTYTNGTFTNTYRLSGTNTK